VCFFYCIQPPSKGGQTTICDGVKIVERLPADLQAEMARHKLVYIQRASPQVLKYWFGKSDPSDAIWPNRFPIARTASNDLETR
jgi:hypothetical protein